MILPKGVSHQPRQAKLIGIDEFAIISIDSSMDNNGGYTVTEASFSDLEECLKGDWDDFDNVFRFERVQGEADGKKSGDAPEVVVMSVAAHDGNPRKPDVVVIPNLRTLPQSSTVSSYGVLGCSFGRHRKIDSKRRDAAVLPEVYELQSHGMIVLDDESGSMDIWVARPGEKVVVAPGTHMTMYNLGDDNSPLIALRATTWKPSEVTSGCAVQTGPPLLINFDDVEVVFRINRLYVNNNDIKAGLRRPTLSGSQQITLSRTSRQELGPFLYEQLVHNPELIARFAALGIHLRHPGLDAVLGKTVDGVTSRVFFSRPLARALDDGTRVYRFFFGGAAQSPGDAKKSSARSRETILPPREKRSLGRPLVVVVEGAGDWVEQAYRDVFRKKVNRDGREMRVFYADDTRWKPRPKWAYPEAGGLEPWEVYLDKNNASDAIRYAALRPDAVFIVTPDFKHSETARQWLDKAPVVFVEKPFDSHIENVEDLQFSFARRPRTEVVGLDHYQFYALPLKEMRKEIDEIVGTRLRRVDFLLTEKRAIESDRVRSLQHGLSLDLLPHFIALLTFFGDITTIDEITVDRVWTYEPFEAHTRETPVRKEKLAGRFKNETGACLEFTFEDHSGNGFRVPCRAVVGKGFKRDVKYLQVTGAEGRALRIDLNKTRPENAVDEYQAGSLFFLAPGGIEPPRTVLPIPDPYEETETLGLVEENGKPLSRPLESERYSSLLDDLFDGTDVASFSSLSMVEGSQIVNVLDRIWWAVQQSRPWSTHPLSTYDPVPPLKGKF